MGGTQSKGVGLPIVVIVKRLDECICPDERGNNIQTLIIFYE